ncbi:MAG: hypothetical protein J6Y16_11375 [Treponema sp.]|nr:hypothetical protein [Treponema sp.]
MKTQEFKAWLRECGYKPNVVNTRTGNCETVCTYEGDLDDLYKHDGCKDLLSRLCYSTDDECNNRPTKHRIPINGNKRTGSATLKQAVNLYLRFLNNEPSTVKSLTARSSQIAKQVNDWPLWEQPNDDECFQLAKVATKYIRFISPEIVKCIVEENEKDYQTLSAILISHGINPDLYLWEKSSCCFPGVRRYAGSSEISAYRKRSEISEIEDALVLDDNDYPKQIWSFIFRGTQFNKFGPAGYSLAHLIDHKKEKNRMENEFVFPEGYRFESPLYGLYTCATNAVYIPNTLMKPTDFNGQIRNLLVRKAMDLYNSICNIIPPSIKVKENDNGKWDLGNFEWSEPVGTTENLEAFLAFRRRKFEELQ